MEDNQRVVRSGHETWRYALFTACLFAVHLSCLSSRFAVAIDKSYLLHDGLDRVYLYINVILELIWQTATSRGANRNLLVIILYYKSKVHNGR